MAPYSYYYVFSISAVLLTILVLVNLVLLKTAGKTTFGIQFKPGTPEYARIGRLANTRSLAVTFVVLLVLVGNLLNSIYQFAQVDTKDISGSLLVLTIFAMLIFSTTLIILRYQAKNYFPDDRKETKKG